MTGCWFKPLSGQTMERGFVCGGDPRTIPGPRNHKQSRKRGIKSAGLLVERDPCQVLPYRNIGLQIKHLCHDLHLLNQIAVLITNGRSDDSVEAAARLVADNGISLFAVGKCRLEYCQFLRHPRCSRPSRFFLLSEICWLICSVCC